MNVEEVFQFMNGESLAVLATTTENGQPGSHADGICRDARTGNYFRHGQELAEIPEFEEESARRVGDRLHHRSNGAVRGVGARTGRRGAGKVPENLFHEIYRRAGATGLARNHLFCGATEVGEVLRRQSGKKKDRGAGILGGLFSRRSFQFQPRAKCTVILAIRVRAGPRPRG